MIQLETNELIVVSFAGGGGTCCGIEQALGRSPDIAINHDPEAITMHRANHPNTRHYCESVWDVSPRKACAGQPVGLFWASPDCRHFSKAKGGKPVDKNIRGLAWVVIRWARDVRPRLIFVENVEEITTWGPLLPNNKPCPARKGETFKRWVNELKKLGYQVEYRELRASDYGAPTTRKRLFLIARCDGLPIVWPAPTHGPGRPLPYRTAAECIDWSIPCPSIFERARPLAENTLRRIARGLKRYVIDTADPFVIPLTHHGERRAHPISEPLPTVTGAHRGELALVAPAVTRIGHTGHGDSGKSRPADAPLSTITSKNEHLLVCPVLAELGHGEKPGCERRPVNLHEPIGTLMAGGNKFALVAPTLVQTGYGEREGQAPRSLDLHQPLGTIVGTQKHAFVSAFLAKNYGDKGQAPGSELSRPVDTITAVDHHSLITAHLQRDFGRSVGSSAEDPMLTITSRGKTGLVACHLRRDFGQSVGSDLGEPLPTVMPDGGGKSALVTSHLVKLRGGLADHHTTAQDLREPASTITAGGTHLAEVRAFLIKYFGTGTGTDLLDPLDTITTRDRFGLVTVAGEQYQIADIGLRMLSPRELFTAQGFPSSYRIEVEHKGKTLSKTAQVRMVGNSVSPPVACALVLANVGATAAMGPSSTDWQPGMVKSGEQMALFDLEAIA